VSSFNIRLLGITLQRWHILQLFTIAQCLKLSWKVSRFGLSYGSGTTFATAYLTA
jgi:hypothetical protein